MSDRLTLDYGVRFVHQQPQYDTLGQASNFLPEKWSIGAAPHLYVPGCTVAQNPGTACPAANRQAKNPLTGQFLGPNTTLAIATLVPNSGNTLNGLFLAGQEGLPKATYSAPALGIAPRFGMAYDVTGEQKIVLRGGLGLYFDRPSSTTFSGGVNNPPTSGTVTVRYSQAAEARQPAASPPQGAPSLSAFPRDIKLPSVDAVERRSADDAAVVVVALGRVRRPAQLQHVPGHEHQHRRPRRDVPAGEPGHDARGQHDSGRDAAYRTTCCARSAATATSTCNGSAAGGRITRIQLSFQRRFQNGLSFGFTDTIGLYGSAAGRRASRAQRGRHAIGCATIRRRPTNCSATTTRSRTSCARTSCGICRTCVRTTPR